MRRERGAGRIKGAAFREFVRWYAHERSEKELHALVERLPQEFRENLRPDKPALGILAGTWYSAHQVHAILDVIVEHHGRHAQRELADAGAAAVMSATLRGLYKVLFQWMATPARYAKYCHKLWDSYYDCGTFTVVGEPGKAVCDVADWDTHHPFICDLNRAAAEEIYRAMGCRDVVTVRETCISEGGPHCRFVTRWRASEADRISEPPASSPPDSSPPRSRAPGEVPEYEK